MNEVERRLREVRRELRGTSWRRRRRLLAEARDHLACALEDGLSEQEAVAALGRPGVAFAGLPQRRRPQGLAVVLGPIALLALAPSLNGTFPRLGSGTPPSQAASPQIAMQERVAAALRQCVTTWNSEPTGRWRAAATQAGIQCAHVGLLAMVRVAPATRKSTTRIAGCNVSLQRAIVPSPYQHTINVYATRTGHTFHFNRLQRGRVRSAAPATNARADSSGRLTLADQRLSATCPSGPIGSRIVSVEALPSRQRLDLTTTTRLAARAHVAYVVSVRNTGRTTIQGAIASLDVGGTAHPGNSWWRSGPKVVKRLAPGESVSLRFTPPDLGHGTRLIRATTAAIACETSIADNSSVFHVKLT